MKKNLRLLIALLAAFALIAAACGGSDDDDAAEDSEDSTTEESSDEESTDEDEDTGEEAAAEGGDELLILQWQAPSQLNALLSGGSKDATPGALVLEPLARFDPSGELTPVLVTEVPTVENGGVSEDFLSITWTLREDIMWSDGTPFTADDVLFTHEYCVDEATGCTADTSIIESVTAEGNAVTVTYTEPKPFPYLYLVGFLQPVIQQAQFADCVGEAAVGCSDQNFFPVGTGPYVVDEFAPEDTVVFSANENYRDAADGLPYIKNVTVKGGGDAEAAARSVLEIGEADYGLNLQVAPEILAPMEAAGNASIVSGFTVSVEHINLNQTDPNGDPPSEGSDHPVLFDNPELARALSLAIDRDALVQVGYGASGAPTCTLWPFGDQYSTNNDWCKERNVEEAISILDGLGYEDTDGDGIREADGTPLSFTYATSTNAVRQSNQDIVKANWEEIGVEVEMLNEDASLFFDQTCAADACIWKFFNDMEMFTNGASVPDPIAYMSGWRQVEIPTSENGWGGSNMPRMQSDEFDALWDETSQLDLADPAYLGNVQQLQDLMIESGAVIPLIHRADVSAISDSISGFGELNGWDSEYWNIEEWQKG